MAWLFDSAGGRKMVLAILGIMAVTALALGKVIEGAVAVETIKWIIIGVAGALAVSDVGNGIAAMNGKASSSTSTPTTPEGGSSNAAPK